MEGISSLYDLMLFIPKYFRRCHVMEVESFENEEVAKLLNDWFVSIKVFLSAVTVSLFTTKAN